MKVINFTVEVKTVYPENSDDPLYKLGRVYLDGLPVFCHRSWGEDDRMEQETTIAFAQKLYEVLS